jgi:sugar-specific transcriptional regulator TrmB
MDEQLISNLQDLGLSDKESRVYIANLALGPSSVQKIADQAGIKRVTTYVILESLVSLGLVSQSVKGKKTFFIAEDPVSLSRLIAKREEELKDQKANFDAILPQLQGLKNLPQDSPSVKFYDGAEGIKSIVKTFYRSVDAEGVKKVYGISNIDQLWSMFPEFREAESNPSRIKSGITSQIIYTTKEGPIFGLNDASKLRESRYVPVDKYPLNGDISIVGSHLLLISLTGPKPVAVTIKSQEIVNGMLAFFHLAWEAAAKYNK